VVPGEDAELVSFVAFAYWSPYSGSIADHQVIYSVIGEPTGTSLKFATMMGQAVKTFFDDKGISDLRLTLIPLEGEGTIDHRVDKWVLLVSCFFS